MTCAGGQDLRCALSSNTTVGCSLKRKPRSHPRHFVVILPFKRQLSSTFYRPGFLGLGTIDVWGCVTLCWGWIAGRLASSLASTSDSAPPLGCDNQKYFPEGNHWSQLCVCVCVCLFACLVESNAVVTLGLLPLIK